MRTQRTSKPFLTTELLTPGIALKVIHGARIPFLTVLGIAVRDKVDGRFICDDSDKAKTSSSYLYVYTLLYACLIIIVKQMVTWRNRSAAALIN